VYIADSANNEIEKVTPAGVLSVVAGNGAYGGSTPGPATSSDLADPTGVAVDGAGNVYIADSNDSEVDKVTSAGLLSIFAGNGGFGLPTPGPATSSELNSPTGVAVDGSGNVYIADGGNYEVEKVTPGGTLSVIAGTGTYGSPTPGPATSSDLADPSGVAVDGAENVYVADYYGLVIEKITPAGVLSIFAGTGTAGLPTPGPATSSELNYPYGVAVDGAGNVYIADSGNSEVEKVTPGGTLSVIAGTGTGGSPTPGPATSSDLADPSGVAASEYGNVYIADTGNNKVEEVAAATTLPVFTAASPPPATIGTAYSYTFTASGSPSPTFSVTSGTLPAGLTLNTTTGVLSGTPTGSGTFRVTATNTVGTAVTSSLTITATAPATLPVFTAASPPAATIGTAYSYTFTASGSPPPTFSVTSGTLPAGLTLNATTGVLSGTPTGSGTFRVTATNTAGTAVTSSITITATAPATLVPVPTGGAVATTPGGAGYWSLAPGGTLSEHGDAANLGSENGATLNGPVVAINSTTTGDGYWLVATDGGVFSYGDAGFYGSAGNIHLNQPIVGMARTPDNRGYWLVAADGGVFTYGDAAFYGSTGNIHLNQPVTGMVSTPDGHGYWLVAADGGVFSYGDAAFYGSAGALNLNKHTVGIATTPDGHGYWLVAADGGVFAYGDAHFYGSNGATGTVPVVGIIANGDNGYRLVTNVGSAVGFGTTPSS
jgi:hypothetical protein